MKSSRSRIALLAFLCGTSILQADILILKNGTKHEGNILSESPTAIRMRYRLTPKIWDEKDFTREEIQEVIKQSPQEVELIELKKLLPTEDLMPADRYEQLIQDRVRPFINKYPGTPEAKEAEGIEQTLQEEKKKVSNGEAKLAGRWMSAAETKGEEYNIGGYKLLGEMKAEMAKNNWIEALRIFDKFSKNRPPYTASSHYPEAVAQALVCLEKQEIILTKMAQEQPALSKLREENLKKLTDEDRARTKAAIDDEKNKWRAQSDSQKRNGIRWAEPYKYDLTSINSLQKSVVAERSKLELINLDEMKIRNEAFVAVYRKIGEADYAGGAAAYERIQSFGSVNEFRDIVADLKNKLLALYGDLVRKSQSAQSAVSGSSAIGGAATSGVDDRVARILAGADGTAPQAPAGTAPAATPGMAAPATAPTAQVPVQAPVPAPAPNPPVMQQPVSPAPYPQPMAAPQAVVEEESNIQTYIMIGMGLLIVVLGALAFMKKKA
ncbi:hypothetical protein EI77_00265 [Prosthecobacter fusiformis]|uniref:LPXTG-motif cell wall-anchored protein n=1 Tax=Prosthecobacter fusiformis TaxID=48464 RepID=A0A4V3FI42_9BACT|nr:PTPDL family protein [Prosthecobacter fusiformis]TDU80963.1 hypothetical protein EI77_00265 [Prosthecobacter fusiformis]